MNYSRAWLVILLAAAIVLAGLGHVFVAFQRDVYPLDGYVFYTLAAIAFAFALRRARDLPETDWSTLRDSLQRALAGLRDLASAFQNIGFGPTLIAGVVILNLLAAALALLFGSALALAGWVISIVWLAAVLWPRAAPSKPRTEMPSEAVRVAVEAADAPADKPRAMSIVIGLLIVALGQIVITLKGAPGEAGFLDGIGDPIANALRMQTLADAGTAIVGLVILAGGALVYGMATRHVVLADRPRLVIEMRSAQRAGWGGRWLLVTLAGLASWLFVAQAATGESIGLGPAVLWLAALTLVGAGWRKVDVNCGVWLGIDIDRREAYGLIALLVASLAIWLLQIDRLPASIWGDEGAYWTMARDISAGRAAVGLFGLGTYSWPAAGSIYQSFWVSLFGPTLAAWRIGSVIATLASLVPLYFLARGMLGRRVTFAALAFFAASPLVLAYGRTGYLYAQSIFPVAAGAALMVAAIRRDSRLFAFLAGAIGGSAFMLYHTARFGIVLCVLVLIAFARMLRGTSLLRLSLAYGSALVLAATPTLVYSLTREPAAFADKLVENSLATVPFAETVFGRDELLARATFTETRDHTLFFEPSLYVTLALRGWAMTAIGLNRAGLTNEHYVVGPLAGPIALLSVLGLGWSLARWRRPGYALWPIWLFAGTFLLSAIESFPPHASDLLPIVPALAVLAAIGLVGLVDTLHGFWTAIPRRIGIGLLVAASALLCAVGLQMYFFEMPQRYKPNLEMAMFWSAFDLPRGSTIAFVRDEAYAPDFTPWGLQNFDMGVTWLPIEPAALDRADVRAACAIDCRIFFTPQNADASEAQLRAVFDGGRVTSFTNEAGETIGYAYRPPGRP